jgi:DNA-binding NtrC family response regulator
LAAAGEGTLLLDEVDALDADQQAVLLRVLETGVYERVGHGGVRRCRARVMAASNGKLAEAVAAGRFRADLYDRLGTLALHLPPLRERVGDISPLARGMAARFNDRFGKGLFTIHPKTFRPLEAFPWPGNLRQLENALQQAVLASAGPELLPQHLPQSVRLWGPSPQGIGFRPAEP